MTDLDHIADVSFTTAAKAFDQAAKEASEGRLFPFLEAFSSGLSATVQAVAVVVSKDRSDGSRSKDGSDG